MRLSIRAQLFCTLFRLFINLLTTHNIAQKSVMEPDYSQLSVKTDAKADAEEHSDRKILSRNDDHDRQQVTGQTQTRLKALPHF